MKSSFDDSSKTFILSTINQDHKNLLTNIDVMNYITDIKNKYIIKITLFTIQNKSIESPRFRYLESRRSFLNELGIMESNILNKIFETKTTKFLLKDYINVIEKKQEILNDYDIKDYTIPLPPLLNKKNPAPVSRKRILKERDIKSS